MLVIPSRVAARDLLRQPSGESLRQFELSNTSRGLKPSARKKSGEGPTVYGLRLTVNTNNPVAAGVMYVTSTFIGYSHAGWVLTARSKQIREPAVMA